MVIPRTYIERAWTRLRPERTVRKAFRGLDDEIWFDALCGAADEPIQKGVRLPGLPDVDLQIASVGEHGSAALREGLRFYREVKRSAAELGRPIGPDCLLLDFGCGWGRITRFFMKDVAAGNLRGADVNTSLIMLCRELMPSVEFSVIEPVPPSPFAPEAFDVVCAYSVFSHLSEAAGARWIEELARILKPGGVLVVTTRGRDFIGVCRGLRGQTDGDPYREYLAGAFADSDAESYNAGRFLFAAYSAYLAAYGPDYGEAIVPRAYVEHAWGRFLRLREFVDDRERLQQAMIVMQKV